jgi:hypothetical protein
VKLSVSEEPVSLEASKSGIDGAEGTPVSITTERVSDAALTFPAASYVFAVMECVPSGSEEDPTDQLPDPSDEEVPIETLPDLKSSIVVLGKAPVPFKVTEVSLVLLSESETPESFPLARSGTEGAFGAEVSNVTVSAPEAELPFPARSVAFAVISYAPSAPIDEVTDQLPDPSAVPLPIDTFPPLNNSMETFASDVPSLVGVISLVRLSEFDKPVSLAL